jgi:hypothetical protein
MKEETARGKSLETMTLGELVTLVADKPTAENRDVLYGRLLFSKVGGRLPETAQGIAVGTHVTTKQDNVGIPSTQGPDGKVYLVVFCDIPAMQAEFPDERLFELDCRVVLEMAQGKGLGVILRNMLDSSQRWVAVPREVVPAILSGRYTRTFVVPPDHKVVVVHPHPQPNFWRCESGVWIAELGGGVGVDRIFSKVRQLTTQPQQTSVLWILQPIMLASPEVFDSVISRLAQIVSESRGVIGHLAVVPYASERHLPMMKRLKTIGLGVYHSGPDGECFIEVHKPEGIVVGMPGEAYSG